MARTVTIKSAMALGTVPWSSLARTYDPLVGDPRPHQLYMVKQEALATILHTIAGTQGTPVFFPVPEFGVCAKLHYVGPKGGVLPPM